MYSGMGDAREKRKGRATVDEGVLGVSGSATLTFGGAVTVERFRFPLIEGVPSLFLL